MDIKFLYNFVFEIIQSKELKTYYDVIFFFMNQSTASKKGKQAHLTKAN